MRRLLFLSLLFTLVAACDESSDEPDLQPFEMSQADLDLQWGIVATQEAACDGGQVAGGYMTGQGTFSQIGLADISISAAWDIARLISSPQFTPASSEAGGPVATVLEGDEYPYVFHFDPTTQQCGNTTSATGELILTASNGDKVSGEVSGGETFRLDFQNPGDGIETFAIITVVGGTGRFQNATGSFVAHTIARFDYTAGKFVIDLAEFSPGGMLGF